MATIFNLNSCNNTSSLDLEKSSDKDTNFDDFNIQIRNNLGDSIGEELAVEFGGYKVAIANQKAIECGGGEISNLFPISNTIYLGIAIYAAVGIGKGFFDEFGRGLAKKLLSILFDKGSNSQIEIVSKAREITIIIPAKTDKKIHAKHIEQIIEKFSYSEEHLKELPNGTYLYVPEVKGLIKLDQ